MDVLIKIIRRLFALFMGIWIVSISLTGICSDEDKEYLVKAAFLYNFAKFIQWSDTAFKTPEEPVNLCLLNGESFGNAIETIRDKEVINKRKLSVRLCRNIKEVSGCHILFISSSESENLPSILSLIRTSPMLTVSDTEGFAQRGMMINLVNIDNKIRFEANMDALNPMPFKLSSQLLKLAIIVNSTSPKE